jgi:hypothetical protein
VATVDNRCKCADTAGQYIPQGRMTEMSFDVGDYNAWLTGLKSRVEQARQRAVLSVNQELISLYWQIGHEILDRQGRGGAQRSLTSWHAICARRFPTCADFRRGT